MTDPGVRRRRLVLHPLVVGSIGLIVLAAIPLAVAAIARPDGRSLADSYLMAVAIIATIQLGAIGWLGCEVTRHRRLHRRSTGSAPIDPMPIDRPSQESTATRPVS